MHMVQIKCASNKALNARSLSELTGPCQERIEGMVKRMRNLDN